MKSLKGLFGLAAMTVLGLVACNYTEGQCYLREDLEGYEGAGGGGVIGPGWGGYGEVPPEPQDATDPPSFDCNAVAGFSSALFKFKTTIPDDGQGEAGGWQQAMAALNFVDTRQSPPQSWSCPVTVELPIRTSTRGVISPTQAAEMSAQAATVTSSVVMHSRDSWLPSLFCIKFKEGMVKAFAALYPGCGGRVY